MKPEEMLDHVAALARDAADPASGLRQVADFLDPEGKALGKLRKAKIERDVAVIRKQLTEVIAAEPPPPEVTAIYFGLFESEDDDGEEAIGYYVSGVITFDPDSPDSLVNPAWCPEDRYLTSRVLRLLKQAEAAASEDGADDLRSRLSYAGQIGLAMLLSRFASEGLFAAKQRIVGFDSGDFALL